MESGLLVSELGVSVRGGGRILQGVSLEVRPSEVCALMGPNGSGKSTLALTLAGHPRFRVDEGWIHLDGEDITRAEPEYRAKKGLFLAFQKQVEIPGLPIEDMIWEAYRARWTGERRPSLIDFRKRLMAVSSGLGFGPELLRRGVNEGFSGGEGRKAELIQMLMLNPRVSVLDEIDSGLDVDSLGLVIQSLREYVKGGGSALVITHHPRLLSMLNPARVYVLIKGRLVGVGGQELAELVEREGFSRWGEVGDGQKSAERRFGV